MDPAYEFQAPQFVDFNNIGANDDNAVDEFFNVDMESGEEWATAVSTLEEDDDHIKGREVANSSKQDATFQVTAPVRIPHQVPHSLPLNHPPSSSLDIQRKPGKPTNMVTSWGTGQVTRISGKGYSISTKPPVKKVPPGKVGRADLHAAVKSTIGVGRSSPRLLHRTPRRLGVCASRLLGGTPKRLGTNSHEPRLASAARPRSQIQRSLNTPTASRSRRRSKSPSIPIPFPKTPEVVVRFKNRMLGEDLPLNQPSKQPADKFRSQAEQILSFQRSTPSRFRSRPHQPSKSSSVPQRQLPPILAGQNLGGRLKSAKSTLPPKMTTNARSIPKKATVVESLTKSAKTKNDIHQRRPSSSEAPRDPTTRPSITIPAPFKFTTQVRAGEREKFEAFKRKKESAAEERKRIEDEKQAKENEEALVQARRALVHKAQPIRNFKPLEIKRSDKKLTMPASPNFGLLKGPNCSR